MNTYPVVPNNPTIKDLATILQNIVRTRNTDDITDRNNFPNIFVSGRTTTRIPASSTDVQATDRVGDFNATATYLYILINNGTPAWRRITMGVF